MSHLHYTSSYYIHSLFPEKNASKFTSHLESKQLYIVFLCRFCWEYFGSTRVIMAIFLRYLTYFLAKSTLLTRKTLEYNRLSVQNAVLIIGVA